MARHIAKSIVASNLADKCEIQIAYAIGVAEPVSVMVDTFNTEKISKNEIVKKVKDNFDLTPLGIIRHLDLLRPIYTVTTSGGHFGRKAENGYFTWEKVKKL